MFSFLFSSELSSTLSQFFDFAEKEPFNSVGTFVVFSLRGIVSAAIGKNSHHIGDEQLLGAKITAL